MPKLTRRLTWRESPDDWSIFYGDIGVGRIMRHQGTAKVMWRWVVGFYPGAHPRDNVSGTADNFEQASEQWKAAWERYLPDRTEAEFEAYRAWHRDKS